MRIDQHTTLTDDLADQAWQLYHEVFEPLAIMAAQSHGMPESDFKKVCAEPGHIKLLAYNRDDELVGVATITNDLNLMHMITHISVPYFAHHWPDEYQRQAIWYVGFVGVRQHGDTRNAFRDILLALHDHMNSNNGISFQDYCRNNVDNLEIARITQMLFNRAGRKVNTFQVDDQSTWILKNVEGGA